MARTDYTEKHIKTLDPILAIQRSPGMSLGDLSTPFNALKEVIDNAGDEAIAGAVKEIFVRWHNQTHECVVCDDGRGIPIRKAKEAGGIPALIAVFTRTNTGGKFEREGGAYSLSVGCFAGSTRIKLLDGTSPTIEQLYERWDHKRRSFWVYAFDLKGKTAFVPRKCYGVHKTKRVTQISVVTLDNGRIIECTTDHPFLTWDGRWVAASLLEAGTSLRGLHCAVDWGGYETHSGRFRHCGGKVKSHHYRTNRTVLNARGSDIDGKHVHHVNGNKTDNRPRNLEALSSKEHFARDFEDNGKHRVFVYKSRKMRQASSRNAQALNADARQAWRTIYGRIVQVSARALRDHGRVDADTYTACRGWCYPTAITVTKYGSWEKFAREAKLYLRRYGPDGKSINGARGLNYRLESEHGRRPVDNCINHKVVSTTIKHLDKPVQVYGMSVHGEHNYLLDAGVFVKNTHGVGAKASNALAKEFEVWTHQNGKWYHVLFRYGKLQGKIEPVAKPLIRSGVFAKRGTQVRVLLSRDKSAELATQSIDSSAWFESLKIDPQVVRTRCFDMAYMLPTVTIHFQDGDKEPEQLHFDGGMVDFVRDEVARLAEAKGSEITPMHEDILALDHFKRGHGGPRLALQWTNDDEEHSYTYVNCSPTKWHGVHYQGVCDAITTAVARFGGGRKAGYSPEDLRVGLVLALNVFAKDPKFEHQTKGKLTHPKTLAKEVHDQVLPLLTKYFRKHRALAKEIVDKARELRALINRTATERKTLKGLRVKGSGKTLLMEKYCDTKPGCKAADRELFLVEGDSFAPETRVRLLDGRDLAIKQIVEEHGQGKRLFCFTFNHATGKIEPTEIKHPRCTRKDAHLVRVHLNNGEHVDVTADHRFMLRDGSYCKAGELQSGASLMPLYLRCPAGYDFLRQPSGGSESVHRMVWRHYRGLLTSDHDVHHINEITTDNSPSNLRCTSHGGHSRLHGRLARYWKKPKHRLAQSARITKLMSNLETREHLSKKARNVWKNKELRRWRAATTKKQCQTAAYRRARKQAYASWRAASYERFMTVCRALYDDGVHITATTYQHKKLELATENSHFNGPQLSIGLLRFFQRDLNAWKAAIEQFNHKVTKVVVLRRGSDTYDLAIEGTRNYALSCGVFVHNSAYGPVREARDPAYQAVLALKGKPPNTARKSLAEIADNKEIQRIIQAVAAGVGEECKVERSRVGRIMIMCFTGDTRVPLADGSGRVLTMEQLVAEYGRERPFLIYATTPAGDTVRALAYNARQTGMTHELATVTLANGEELRCSSDHLFVVTNPQAGDPRVAWHNGVAYVAARDLNDTDDLAEPSTPATGIFNVNPIIDGRHMECVVLGGPVIDQLKSE